MIANSWLGQMLAVAAIVATSSSANAQSSQLPEDISAQDKTTSPFHIEITPFARFEPLKDGGQSLDRRHVRTNTNWAAVSQVQAEKGGSFPDYSLYVGVTKDGRFEGVIYGGLMPELGPKVAKDDLNAIGQLVLSAAGVGEVEIDLGEIEKATVYDLKNPNGNVDIYMRRFVFPQKAYRMLGAAPDYSSLHLTFVHSDTGAGEFSYYPKSQPDENLPWIMFVDYAKELSRRVQMQNSSE